jgi:hypothetical protein
MPYPAPARLRWPGFNWGTMMENMTDIFREEETRLLAEGRAAIAAETAAWNALSQAERDAITAEREARFAALDDADEGYDDGDDDEDDDEDED